MPTIKIKLEHEELAAIERHADALGIKVEDLAYGALNCMMTNCLESSCRGRAKQAVGDRGVDLPLWSDSARSVAAYESMGSVEGGRGPKAKD